MPENITENKLLSLCYELFDLVKYFLLADKRNLFYKNYYEKVVGAFLNFETRALEINVEKQKLEDIKYALTALFDEIVLKSDWAFRSAWLVETLQMRFFGEHIAGEGFFKRLTRLKQNLLENVEIVEIYYLCLQFGFEGVFYIKGEEQLYTLKNSLHLQLEVAYGEVNNELAMNAIPQTTGKEQHKSGLPIFTIIFLLIMMIILIDYGFIIFTEYDVNKLFTLPNNRKFI